MYIQPVSKFLAVIQCTVQCTYTLSNGKASLIILIYSINVNYMNVFFQYLAENLIDSFSNLTGESLIKNSELTLTTHLHFESEILVHIQEGGGGAQMASSALITDSFLGISINNIFKKLFGNKCLRVVPPNDYLFIAKGRHT